jgi:hypothetical protein
MTWVEAHLGEWLGELFEKEHDATVRYNHQGKQHLRAPMVGCLRTGEGPTPSTDNLHTTKHTTIFLLKTKNKITKNKNK